LGRIVVEKHSGVVLFVTLIKLFNILHRVLVILLVHGFLGRLLRCLGRLLNVLVASADLAWLLFLTAGVLVLRQAVVGQRTVDAQVFAMLQRPTSLRLHFVTAPFFLVRGHVFGQSFEIEPGDGQSVDVFECGLFVDFGVEPNILKAVIGIKAHILVIIFLLHAHSCLCRSIFLLLLLVLAHDLLESVGVDEFDSVFFIDLVDRDALVLQRVEEVNELGHFVCVVGFFLRHLFQLAGLVVRLNHQV